MRGLLVKMVGFVPSGVKDWIYRHPWLSVPLSRVLGRLVPADRAIIVTVKGGPNKGAKLAIDRNVPRVFWLNENYEREVFDVLQRYIRPGMTVADIGAYIGFDTLAMSRLVGPAGRVLAFEPDPRTAQRLRLTCDLNGLRNATLFSKAVSDRSAMVPFVAQAGVKSHLLGPASGNGDDGADANTVMIESVRLDDVIFGEPSPSLGLVKLDAEDFEAEVLKGSPRVLAELGPVWIIEIHSPRSLAGCVRELTQFGYQVRPLDFESYYSPAIAAISNGGEPPAQGFERGHVLALKQ